MIRNGWIFLLALALTAGLSNVSHASGGDMNQFNAKYGTSGTALDSCTVCHTTTPATNSFGKDFADPLVGNHTFNAALEAEDSDGDTFSNITEINARKFPGNPNSKPAGPTDTIPPTASLSSGSFLTPRKVNITLTATDDAGGSGVKGYMVKLNATMPSKSASSWKTTPPAAYTFPTTATTGPKTLYAWAKDKAGNISAPVSVAVDLDVSKPTVSAFTAQATSPASVTVNVSITATDPAVNGVASGVTAYMVTKSNLTPPLASSTKWINGASPTSVTFPKPVKAGATLYAWVKDTNGNVSKAKSAKVTAAPAAVALVAQQVQPMAAPAAYGNAAASKTSQATTPDTSADMTIWIGRWFKVTMKNEGYYGGKSGFTNDRQNIPGYLKIRDWDPARQAFPSDLYQQDGQTGEWFSTPLDLQYTGGESLDFKVSSLVVGDFTYGFTARIQGTQTSVVTHFPLRSPAISSTDQR
jgi:hypothetical protein